MIEPIARMVNQLSKLPGVGQKTAQRLAYHIVSMPEEQVRELAAAIFNGKKNLERVYEAFPREKIEIIDE